MSKLIHEIWEEITDDGIVLHTCCLSGPRGEECRQTVAKARRCLSMITWKLIEPTPKFLAGDNMDVRIIDDHTAETLRKLHETTTILDADGRVMGYFTPPEMPSPDEVRTWIDPSAKKMANK
jgi:hypothetical protein